MELGTRVRELYIGAFRTRIGCAVADDAFLERFAGAVAGELGGKVGIAPRLFLRKLVDVLDKIEQFPTSTPTPTMK